MPGGVQADGRSPDAQALPVAQGLQLDTAQAGAQHAFALRAAQVGRVAAACVVSVGVGDDGPVHRPPGVDVEIARGAVQPLGPQDDQVTVSSVGHDVSF
jgi:hypothetical protein